jgi:hypothetical protein
MGQDIVVQVVPDNAGTGVSLQWVWSNFIFFLVLELGVLDYAAKVGVRHTVDYCEMFGV